MLRAQGSTFVQHQYPKFSCSLQCHLLAARAEPLCYGMDPSPSEPVPSGLDSNPAWLETHSEKKGKVRSQAACGMILYHSGCQNMPIIVI